MAESKITGRLIPVTKWNEFHIWPPIGGLRHLIFHAKTNGFDRVIKRAGSRIFLDEDAFLEWIDMNANQFAPIISSDNYFCLNITQNYNIGAIICTVLYSLNIAAITMQVKKRMICITQLPQESKSQGSICR